MSYRNTKFSYELDKDILTIKTDLGYILKYKLNLDVQVDPFTKYDDNLPDFVVTPQVEFQEQKVTKQAIPFKQLATKLSKENLIKNTNFSFIHVGFIYSPGDPNNHRWMINAFDKDNNFLFNFIGDNIKMNCPFSTVSWQDGIWHGRFIIDKKDITSIFEPKPGNFIIKGKSKLNPKIEPIKEKIDKISVRYNIEQNLWYCDYKYKNNQIGSYPTKHLICDVPFEGNIDRNHSKPKVTAELKAKDIKGISVGLDRVVIKKK